MRSSISHGPGNERFLFEVSATYEKISELIDLYGDRPCLHKEYFNRAKRSTLRYAEPQLIAIAAHTPAAQIHESGPDRGKVTARFAASKFQIAPLPIKLRRDIYKLRRFRQNYDLPGPVDIFCIQLALPASARLSSGNKA